MPSVILRDGIAPSCGKYVANEPLTPSEHREWVFFRNSMFCILILPPSGQILPGTKKSSFFRFFVWKTYFWITLGVFKTVSKTEYAGISTFSELLFFVCFLGEKWWHNIYEENILSPPSARPTPVRKRHVGRSPKAATSVQTAYGGHGFSKPRRIDC